MQYRQGPLGGGVVGARGRVLDYANAYRVLQAAGVVYAIMIISIEMFSTVLHKSFQ
jgi:hypothetical protein